MSYSGYIINNKHWFFYVRHFIGIGATNSLVKANYIQVCGGHAHWYFLENLYTLVSVTL